MNNDYEQKYLANLTNIPQIIPELGDIISEYTGGVCDAQTQGGSQCWYNNKNCENYCFDNLDSWLYNLFKSVINKNSSILMEDNNGNIKTIVLPVYVTHLKLQFGNNYPNVDSIFIKTTNYEIFLQINFGETKEIIWKNIFPNINELPEDIRYYASDYYFSLSWKSNRKNSDFIVEWIYLNIIIPLVQFEIEKNNVIEATYGFSQHINSSEFKQFIIDNNLNSILDLTGYQEHLVGINSIIPVGYAKLTIKRQNHEYSMSVESTSNFTLNTK